jgi:hypothetical protein
MNFIIGERNFSFAHHPTDFIVVRRSVVIAHHPTNLSLDGRGALTAHHFPSSASDVWGEVVKSHVASLGYKGALARQLFCRNPLKTRTHSSYMLVLRKLSRFGLQAKVVWGLLSLVLTWFAPSFVPAVARNTSWNLPIIILTDT